MEKNQNPEKDKNKKEIDPNTPTANNNDDKQKKEGREVGVKKEETPQAESKSQDTTSGTE